MLNKSLQNLVAQDIDEEDFSLFIANQVGSDLSMTQGDYRVVEFRPPLRNTRDTFRGGTDYIPTETGFYLVQGGVRVNYGGTETDRFLVYINDKGGNSILLPAVETDRGNTNRVTFRFSGVAHFVSGDAYQLRARNDGSNDELQRNRGSLAVLGPIFQE